MRIHNYVIFSVVAGFGLIIDQVTKLFIVKGMPLYASVPVIDNFFNITYVRNPGAAFGLFAESGFRIPFLIGVSLIALAAILVALYKSKRSEKISVVALSCIFAGACGNLIDRVRLGEVIDFLDCYWKNHHWPAFNVADMAICIGVFLYLAAGLMEKQQRPSAGHAA